MRVSRRRHQQPSFNDHRVERSSGPYNEVGKDGEGNAVDLALSPAVGDINSTTKPTPLVSPSQSPRKRRRRKRPGTLLWDNFVIREPPSCSVTDVTLPYLILAIVVVFYVTTSMYMFHVSTATSTQQQQPPIPRIPVAHVDIPVPSAMEWPIVHIVNTRFMQEQGPLVTLGMARFHLFMTFCFPTMISQSSQHFFWIIKTDPQFTQTTVFDLMLQAIQSVSTNHHNNIYLVASNNNFLIHPQTKGTWRDGTECLDLLQSKIYTGNITKLKMAMALRNERPVVETRLDADDGLHMHYLKYIQLVALKRFQPALYHARHAHRDGDREDNDGSTSNSSMDPKRFPPAPRWLYWCTRRHLEWHSSVGRKVQLITNSTENDDDKSSVGVLAPIQHDNLCVTPGMTVGYNIDVDSADVPFHSHDTLYKAVKESSACYPSGRLQHTRRGSPPCLDLVEDLLFCALRSRTLTSAGMLKVENIPAFRMDPKINSGLWQLLDERFNVSKSKVTRTQDFLQRHRKEIAYENILGQCTTGHSCKDQAKAELQRIIDDENTAASHT